MNINKLVVPDDILRSLRARNLFYPSAGGDFLTPIKAFAPWVNDFWFVDTNYDSKSALCNDSDYRLSERSTGCKFGTTMKRGKEFQITVFHENYQHVGDNQIIHVHKCCGHGYDAFRTFFKSEHKPLSIFFYRGDSNGEGGGSGFFWLEKEILKGVFELLEDGGLLVTDCSNCKIKKLKEFHRDFSLGSEAIDKAEPLLIMDRRLHFVGCIRERYVPTLIWRASYNSDLDVRH